MPEDLVISSTKPTAIPVPLGTDKRKAASVRTPFQYLANWAQWLDDKLAGLMSGSQTFAALNGAIITADEIRTAAAKIAGYLHSRDGVGFSFMPLKVVLQIDAASTLQRNRVHVLTALATDSADWTMSDAADTLTGTAAQAGDWVIIAVGAHPGTITLKASTGATIQAHTAAGVRYGMYIRSGSAGTWYKVL